MRDTVQAKLMQLGLLRPDASAGWELTQQGREILSATLVSPAKSALVVELLKLGVIECAPIGSSLSWVFTPQGRRLVTYLLNNPTD
jgi:hypothetical protein